MVKEGLVAKRINRISLIDKEKKKKKKIVWI